MGGKKEFELTLEIGQKSTPLSKKLPNGYTHKWTAFVRGANNTKIDYCIQRVVFELHESFENPKRVITESPYQVKEVGYAGFEIPIQIHFKNRERPNIVHALHDLHLLTNKPNDIKKTMKTKFINPSKEFEKCLLKSGARLVSPAIKKERSDSPPAKKHKSTSLIPSKDMSKQPQPQSQTKSTSGGSSGGSKHHEPPAKKPSSREFVDLFGAPLAYNSNDKRNTGTSSNNNHVNNTSISAHSHTINHTHPSTNNTHTNTNVNHSSISNNTNYSTNNSSNSTNISTSNSNNTTSSIGSSSNSSKPKDEPKKEHHVSDLRTIQNKIWRLSDCDRLQKIVDIVEEAGEWFNLTPKKFEFDLKRLDKKTLSKIERCLH